ncbi:MAG: TolC family protein [Bacteroidales bacterium]|nr:TolC family protein [Bacteroidales bacterium]
MLKKIFLVALFSTILCPQVSFAQKTITLQESIALATENYPATIRYNLIGKVKEFNISNIEKSWLPKAGVTIQGTYQSHVTEIPILVPGMEVDPLNRAQYSAVIAINQTIWDGGATGVSKKEAQAKATLDVKRLEAELYSIKERVSEIYFGILLLDQYLKETKVLGRELNRMQSKVFALIASGVADSTVLYPIQAEQISLEQRAKELQSNKSSYLKVLSLMTGRASDTAATLLLPMLTKPISYEINRPEINVFEIQKELAQIGSLYIDSRLMPKVGAFVQVGYGLPGLNMLKNKPTAFYIGGIKLSWNLDGLYTRKNDLQKIVATKASIESQKETFLYNTRLQNSLISKEIKKIEELSKGDQKLVEIREKIVESSSVKLENGATSVSEHLKEINMLDAARLALGKREIELLKALSDLKNNLNQ